MADYPPMVPVAPDTHPSEYRNIQLRIDGPVARILLDIKEGGGQRPGYELKLNSYDIGVDVELADAVNRLRWEHPEVGSCVIGSMRGIL